METERLYFRRYEKSDKSFLINLFTDAKVMTYVDNGVMTETQAEEWWRKLFEKFYPQDLQIRAIFTKADFEYIGHAGIYPRQSGYFNPIRFAVADFSRAASFLRRGIVRRGDHFFAQI